MGEPDIAWAPAKINLVLEVGARRPDGYHELATIFQSVGLYDRVTISDTVTPGDLVVSGPQARRAELHDPRANLAWRAAELLAQATGRSAPGVQIQLEKHIPVAAGLGGGSSDAAAVLRALATRWAISDQQLLLRLASELGSDVPFFLRSGAALGRGRGELLSSLSLPCMWVVLANPGIPSSTASVYSRFARDARPRVGVLGGCCEQVVQALCREGPASVEGHLWRNDLAEAALKEVPSVGPILGALRNLGALGAQISGSGATVFAVAADAAHAESMSDQVSELAAWTWWGPTIASEEEATSECSKANQT